MQSFQKLAARGQLAARSLTDGSSDTVINAMIALLSLVFVSLVLAAVLVLLKRMKRQQQMRIATLPQYHEVGKRASNHRGLTIETTSPGGRRSVFVFGKDGQPMLSNPDSPPHSPDNVPEIHITFPDEDDEQGRRKSGRVVVVRVGDATVGMEPLHEEQLPAYEKESKTGWVSLDIDSIGGLKEKEYK